MMSGSSPEESKSEKKKKKKKKKRGKKESYPNHPRTWNDVQDCVKSQKDFVKKRK